MNIRPCQLQDAQAICDIYNRYVAETTITFEEDLVSVDEFKKRINSYTEQYPWYVCEVDNHVIGYAYATKWKERSAYRHSAEVTVYIKYGFARRGYGKALYARLLAGLANTNCHAILAGIALPNDASIKLHESFGFTKIAHFSEVGFKFQRWIDVGYWQKTQ